MSKTHVHRVAWMVRTFCQRNAADPDRIRAIPVPEDIKALCL